MAGAVNRPPANDNNLPYIYIHVYMDILSAIKSMDVLHRQVR